MGTLGVHEVDREPGAEYGEAGIGLGLVPDVGEGSPLRGRAHQQPGFQQAAAHDGRGVVVVVEILDQYRTYGKVKDLGGVVGGLGTFGEVDEAGLTGVVRKEGCAHLIGDHTGGGLQLGQGAGEEAVIGEPGLAQSVGAHRLATVPLPGRAGSQGGGRCPLVCGSRSGIAGDKRGGQ